MFNVYVCTLSAHVFLALNHYILCLILYISYFLPLETDLISSSSTSPSVFQLQLWDRWSKDRSTHHPFLRVRHSKWVAIIFLTIVTASMCVLCQSFFTRCVWTLSSSEWVWREEQPSVHRLCGHIWVCWHHKWKSSGYSYKSISKEECCLQSCMVYWHHKGKCKCRS